MVQLYTCQACLDALHEECERGHPAKAGNFGGRSCVCPCLGRSDAKRKKDWEKHVGDMLKACSQ